MTEDIAALIKRIDAQPPILRDRTLLVDVRKAFSHLTAQLPEGMEHCTIRFKECEKGHGRLTADNWVDHGCPHCEIDRLTSSLPPEEIKRLLAEIREVIDFENDLSAPAHSAVYALDKATAALLQQAREIERLNKAVDWQSNFVARIRELERERDEVTLAIRALKQSE